MTRMLDEIFKQKLFKACQENLQNSSKKTAGTFYQGKYVPLVSEEWIMLT